MPTWDIRDSQGESIGELELNEGFEVVEVGDLVDPPPPPAGAQLWSELFPSGASGDVVIDGDVVLDVDAQVTNLVVSGTLTFDPDTSLLLVVFERFTVTGTLVCEPAGFDVFHDISIPSFPEYIGGDEGMMTDPGLHVMGGGTVRLVGPERAGWCRAQGGLLAGQLEIDVDSPVGWQVDDELLVTPTQHPSVAGFSIAYSGGWVHSVAGDTVELQGPLVNAHPQVQGHTAEVLNLTRNVTISSVTGRGHVMIHATAAPVRIEHVSFDNLGPDVVGRYPLHFHKCGDAQRGVVVKGCLVAASDNRAFVVHGTHGVTLEDCVAHDVKRRAFWWDPSIDRDDSGGDDSHDVLYLNCVASLIQEGAEPIRERYRLGGFWLTGGDRNECRGCVAVGVQGRADAAGFTWPEPPGQATIGVWVFDEGNVAHNNLVHGIFTWQNTKEPHEVRNFVGYHNGDSGIDHGAYRTGYLYEDCVLIGNGSTGFQLHSSSQATPVQTIRRLRVDGSPNGLVTRQHNLPAGAETLIEDPVFTNVDVPLRANAVDDGSSHPDLVRVTGYDGDLAVGENVVAGWQWTLVRTDGTEEVISG
ncbi:MAG: hypothetical protein AAGA99_00675 [Actinomycetota bacterium]